MRKWLRKACGFTLLFVVIWSLIGGLAAAIATSDGSRYDFGIGLAVTLVVIVVVALVVAVAMCLCVTFDWFLGSDRLNP